MSLRQDDLSAGGIRGTIYTFEKAGDVLGWHVHGSADAHITIVARGAVRMETGQVGREGYTTDRVYELSAGHCIDTGAGVSHQFVATEDNSRIYNIIKEPLS
jgi:mannose-6-phosphate isomerase-like protein (cupin superfamily)